MTRSIAGIAVCAMALLAPDCLAGAPKEPGSKPPNVVIILTDDK
ncbi:MAG TPA: hypothetical protein VGY58_10590 [Gemmataceae bacterium]|jgi:hypothetical protein|nr:hypothetical protein [Gemmataceae bacterium]